MHHTSCDRTKHLISALSRVGSKATSFMPTYAVLTTPRTPHTTFLRFPLTGDYDDDDHLRVRERKWSKPKLNRKVLVRNFFELIKANHKDADVACSNLGTLADPADPSSRCICYSDDYFEKIAPAVTTATATSNNSAEEELLLASRSGSGSEGASGDYDGDDLGEVAARCASCTYCLLLLLLLLLLLFFLLFFCGGGVCVLTLMSVTPPPRHRGSMQHAAFLSMGAIDCPLYANVRNPFDVIGSKATAALIQRFAAMMPPFATTLFLVPALGQVVHCFAARASTIQLLLAPPP